MSPRSCVLIALVHSLECTRCLLQATSTLDSISMVLSMHTVPAAGPEHIYGITTVLSIPHCASHRSCTTEGGQDDLKKGTQLLEIYALEIQVKSM